MFDAILGRLVVAEVVESVIMLCVCCGSRSYERKATMCRRIREDAKLSEARMGVVLLSGVGCGGWVDSVLYVLCREEEKSPTGRPQLLYGDGATLIKEQLSSQVDQPKKGRRAA